MRGRHRRRGPMKSHPYRIALLCLLAGVVSFFGALFWPDSIAQTWSTSDNHFLFVVAFITWAVIPVAGVVLAISFSLYGLATRGRRRNR